MLASREGKLAALTAQTPITTYATVCSGAPARLDPRVQGLVSKELRPMSRDLLPGVTGVLVLADGTVLQGIGVGAVGEAVGEVCFNTAMTGYQEILTDPSYMAQIVAFTFPHVGNTGTNVEDLEQMSGSAA